MGRTSGGGAGLLGLLSCLLLGPSGELQGQDSSRDAIRRLARDVVSRGRFQDRLEFTDGETSSRRRVGPAARRGRARGEEPETRLPGGSWGSLGKLALLVLVVVGAILLGAALLHARWQSAARSGGTPAPSRDASRGPGHESPQPGAGPGLPADDLFCQADRLAQEGKLEEAVHLLLLGAIRSLQERLGGQKASATSRELVSLLPLDGEGRRQALRALVLAVESSFFGGRPVERGGYEACRESLAALLGRTPA